MPRHLASAALGAYYLATGIWPLAHMASFQLVTGRKHEDWLVRTVGVLVAALGLGVLAGAARGRVAPELRAATSLSAAGIAAIDVVYVRKGRIRPVYLVDAAFQLLLLAGLAREAVSIVRGMQMRREGHRDEVGERVGARYGAAGEEADRADVRPGALHRE